MLVVFRKHLLPEVFRLPGDQVLSLNPVERVSVGAVDQLIITLSWISFVGNDCEVRVSILAKFSNHSRVVELVGREKFLRILMSIYFHFSHSVVDSRDLDVF